MESKPAGTLECFVMVWKEYTIKDKEQYKEILAKLEKGDNPNNILEEYDDVFDTGTDLFNEIVMSPVDVDGDPTTVLYNENNEIVYENYKPEQIYKIEDEKDFR